jgi:ABC-type nitrate/sulfonate/bicarbonate transport system substrate-binding protein
MSSISLITIHLLIDKRKNITKHKVSYSEFIKATQKGFLFTKNNLTESVEILNRYVTEVRFKNIDLEKNQYLSQYLILVTNLIVV